MLATLAGSIIGRLAPHLLSRVLGGGQRGEAIGQAAVNLAMRIAGVDDADQAADIIQQDPNKLLEFQTALAEKDAELEKAYLADRQDARDRDLKLAQLGRTNWRGDVLAFAAISGLIGTIALVMFLNVPDGPARDIILILAGALITIVKDVYAFEFGSSRGSKEKGAELASRVRGNG